MTVLVALVLNWKLIKSFTEIPITKKVVPKLSNRNVRYCFSRVNNRKCTVRLEFGDQ